MDSSNSSSSSSISGSSFLAASMVFEAFRESPWVHALPAPPHISWFLSEATNGASGASGCPAFEANARADLALAGILWVLFPLLIAARNGGVVPAHLRRVATGGALVAACTYAVRAATDCQDQDRHDGIVPSVFGLLLHAALFVVAIVLCLVYGTGGGSGGRTDTDAPAPTRAERILRQNDDLIVALRMTNARLLVITEAVVEMSSVIVQQNERLLAVVENQIDPCKA
jgi:hypothetical protein